jgi:transposase-like protein
MTMPATKLTDAKAAEIRHAFARGTGSKAVLSRRFGVSVSTIASVIWGKIYPNAGGPIVRPGPRRRGEESPNAWLTAAKVVRMREAYAGGEVTYAELAQEYRISTTAVRHAVTGKTWQTAGGPIAPAARGRVRGDSHHQSKLTRTKVAKARRCYARGGVTLPELAREYGVSQGVMGKAINGRTWRDAGGPINRCRRTPRDEDVTLSKLTTAKVVEMRETYARGRVSHAELAQKYGVTAGAVHFALVGKTWKHAGGPITPRRHGPLRGEASPVAKLTTAKVAQIFRLRAETGMGYGRIAQRFGVTPQCIRSVVKGWTWKTPGSDS